MIPYLYIISIRLPRIRSLGIFMIWCLFFDRWVGLPLLSHFFLGWGTFVIIDTGKKIIGICPFKDDEEIRRDPDEVGSARILSLVGTPLFLANPSSQRMEALIGHSTCSELIDKQNKFRDPSQGILILKGTLFHGLGRHHWKMTNGLYLFLY